MYIYIHIHTDQIRAEHTKKDERVDSRRSLYTYKNIRILTHICIHTYIYMYTHTYIHRPISSRTRQENPPPKNALIIEHSGLFSIHIYVHICLRSMYIYIYIYA